MGASARADQGQPRCCAVVYATSATVQSLAARPMSKMSSSGIDNGSARSERAVRDRWQVASGATCTPCVACASRSSRLRRPAEQTDLITKATPTGGLCQSPAGFHPKHDPEPHIAADPSRCVPSWPRATPSKRNSAPNQPIPHAFRTNCVSLCSRNKRLRVQRRDRLGVGRRLLFSPCRDAEQSKHHARNGCYHISAYIHCHVSPPPAGLPAGA
jgi:hypothetical protein